MQVRPARAGSRATPIRRTPSPTERARGDRREHIRMYAGASVCWSDHLEKSTLLPENSSLKSGPERTPAHRVGDRDDRARARQGDRAVEARRVGQGEDRRAAPVLPAAGHRLPARPTVALQRDALAGAGVRERGQCLGLPESTLAGRLPGWAMAGRRSSTPVPVRAARATAPWHRRQAHRLCGGERLGSSVAAQASATSRGRIVDRTGRTSRRGLSGSPRGTVGQCRDEASGPDGDSGGPTGISVKGPEGWPLVVRHQGLEPRTR